MYSVIITVARLWHIEVVDANDAMLARGWAKDALAVAIQPAVHRLLQYIRIEHQSVWT